MRHSLYWDDFNRRIDETVDALNNNRTPTVRRVAVFITNKCNFRCDYCNDPHKKDALSKEDFVNLVEKYGKTAIIHITGGEPSVVPWLYKFIEENGDKYRFHLNTNAYIMPPAKHIKRLKISLDSSDAKQWDCLVRKNGAFQRVVDNIKNSIEHTTVSLTYTLTKQNYRNSIDFAKFVEKEFKGLYAIFFSVYKGTDERFMLSDEESETFFTQILPELKDCLSEESTALIAETIDEKRRLMEGKRFENNDVSEPCYISMSERVISPSGKESFCSHLYRDGIFGVMGKHEKCSYGCNQRLVMFNNEVKKRLKLKQNLKGGD